MLDRLRIQQLHRLRQLIRQEGDQQHGADGSDLLLACRLRLRIEDVDLLLGHYWLAPLATAGVVEVGAGIVAVVSVGVAGSGGGATVVEAGAPVPYT